MCLILFAYESHPKYKLVVAANRDEFYSRPTSPADFWQDNPEILAGRDLREGGTWMGITTNGRFAALTNYRDPSRNKKTAPSRGHLVQRFLDSTMTPSAYIDQIPDAGKEYNGFNLLIGEHDSLYYYSNREQILRPVSPGIHGLSNALLNDPWPKVIKGKQALEMALQHDEVKPEQLFAILVDQEPVEDQELPDTGVGLEMERGLAPAFVTMSGYGTKTSTVILIDHSDQVRFWERSFTEERPDVWTEVYYELSLRQPK
ncbi:MAG: NRDE family protein [Syntrophomonadaceae bacterium]|jgi:uncharacterized protein with NRDE domain|nr:NRDE family protein [Bacillota bacterium]NLP23834.1 NRDE family protein [Syntrophomonadaceae bacterium]